MKKEKILFVMTFVLLGFFGYSQSYVFKVLAIKGSNELKTGNKWEKLKTGATLHEDDYIKVSENGYLGLVHFAGHAMEWKDVGEFKVSDIAKKIPKYASVTQKYADFLSTKMANAGNNATTAGGVHRGGGAGIQVFVPNDVLVYNTEALIRWEPLEGENISYKVKITDMYDELVIEEQTSETFYKLDLKHPKLESSLVVLVGIAAYGGSDAESEEVAIKRLSQSKKQEVVDELIPLMRELNNETAIAKYILAGYFEEKQLLLDAVNNYEAAIKMAPDVLTYREAYEDFLLRNGLKIKTKK